MTKRKVLERRGYAVLGAGDADEALRVSEQHAGSVHLLLTDVVMPGMSGVALVERVTSTRSAMKVLYSTKALHAGHLDPKGPSGLGRGAV